MSKKIPLGVFLLGLIILSGFSGNGEEGWRWQYPVPQGNTLRAARFSADAGIAVGDYGTIIRTSDGGQSWSYVPNPYAQHLRSVCHSGEGKWLAVGGEGLIISSNDDGRTWDRLQSDSLADLFAVEFVTAEIGAAAANFFAG